MNVYTKPLGMVQANCCLIASERGHAAIVDPGGDVAVVKSMLTEFQLVPKMVLLTHGHFDHIAGLWDLLDEWKIPVYLHPEDHEMLEDIQKALCGMVPLYFNYRPGLILHSLKEGDCVALDELSIQVLHTPGHTKGSVCYLVEDTLFSGDTLFAGSVGRTDLPGGDIKTLSQSLQKLLALKTDYTIYSGHGPATTLQRERNSNPFLTGANDDSYFQ